MIGSFKVPTIFSAVDKISPTLDKVNSKVAKVHKTMNTMANYAVVGGFAIAAGLGVALNTAIDFEDKIADVAKTTGIQGEALEKLGKDILSYSGNTRSSVEELLDIGRIGGQLAVAEKDMLSFIKSGDKFAVALGSDYAGGVEEAVLSVAKLQQVYKETRGLDIDDVITRAGSTINQLVNTTKGTAENINDFLSRIGQLPDVFKPSIQSTAALAATLEEMGLNSERGSSGVKNLLIATAREMPTFARMMKISTKAAQELYRQDPAEFLAKFSQSFKGLNESQVANKLKELKINSNEAVGVVGQLSSGYEAFLKNLKETNSAFEQATSISDEYNVKNNTAAAEIRKMKNRIYELNVEIGEKLVPILKDVLSYMSPLISDFSSFVSENEKLIPMILGVAGALIAFKGVMIVINALMVIGQGVMAAYTAIMGAYNGMALVAAVGGYTFAGAVWASVWPILLVIAGIAAIIAIFYYWDEICEWFGKVWSKFTNWIGELWDKLVKWFEEFSFVNFFKQIGNAIIDFMLFPIKQVLELVSKIPGKIGNMAKQALDFTNTLKFEVDSEPQLSPNATAQVATSESITTNNSNIQLDINDKNNNLGGIQQFGFPIPININGTKFGQ